jgi:hypothetical protein
MELTFLILLAGSAWAGDTSLDAQVGNESTYLDGKVLIPAWEAALSGRLGVFAPWGLAGTMMEASPYYFLGASFNSSDGPIESSLHATVGRVDMNTRPTFSDPLGVAGSIAGRSAGREEFKTSYDVLSVYADVGRISRLGQAARLAWYGVAEGMLFNSGSTPNSGQGRRQVAGGLATSADIGRNTVTAFIQETREFVAKNRFRNNEITWAPSTTGGIELTMPTRTGVATVGAEVASTRADETVRPYLSGREKHWDWTVALERRDSRNPFFPDRRGVSARLGYETKSGVVMGAQVSGGHERYEGEREWDKDTSVLLTLSKELGARSRVRSAWSQPRGSEAVGDPVAASRSLNASLPSALQRTTFRDVLAGAETLDEFVAAYPLGGGNEALAVLSVFTQSLDDLNYNHNQESRPNADSVEQIYARARDSIITSTVDPMLVCIGSAQLGAELVRRLSARSGLPLSATAVDVRVTGTGDISAGHAVTAVRTAEHGIVFVDWGQLTPTGTHDVKEALAIFQGLQGIPSLGHNITDGVTGRHVGRIMTEEGRLLSCEVTYSALTGQDELGRLFRDACSGSTHAGRRFRDLTKRK